MKKISIFFCFIAIIAMSANAQTVVEKNGKANVQNIPTGYEIEYLAEDSIEMESGNRYYYVVIRPVKNPIDNTTWDRRVFRGRAGNQLEESKVFRFERYRDGGTTIIQTLYGVLYFPAKEASFNESWQTSASWNIFNKLIRLN